MKLNQYLKIWKHVLFLELAADMIYKLNFFIKFSAVFLADFLGPLGILFIYQHSAGIPGWTFAEFIIFTGTFTVTLGFGRLLFLEMPIRIIQSVRDGSFDKYLTAPFHPLTYLTMHGWFTEGASSVIAGIVLIIWGLSHTAGYPALNIVAYLFLLLMAILFQHAIMILISACALIYVKSWGVFELFFGIEKFARYPLNIFGPGLRIFLTFFFPVAISANYPLETLTKGFNTQIIFVVIIPVLIFYLISILFWNHAIKKYQSAGG